MKILLSIFLIVSFTCCRSQVNDSTIDQKAWFQNAFNNLQPGDVLNLPSGVFLTSYLNVNVDSVTIVGHNTTLKMAAGSSPYHPLIEFWGRRKCTLTGVKLDMSNMPGDEFNGFPAVQIAYSSYVRILNDSIYNNTFAGVRFFGGNDSITITNCLMYKTDACIHVHGLNTRLTFTGNTMTGGTSEGITMYGDDTASEPHDFLIENNTIVSKHNSAGILLVYARNGIITGNIIRDCPSPIGLRPTDPIASDFSLITSDITISNNTFINNLNKYFGTLNVIAGIEDCTNINLSGNKSVFYPEYIVKGKSRKIIQH